MPRNRQSVPDFPLIRPKVVHIATHNIRIFFAYGRNRRVASWAKQARFKAQLFKRHVVCQRTSKPLSVNVTGSQRYRESGRSFWFQRSAMRMNVPRLPATGRIYVLCPRNVTSACGPRQGLPISFHGPQIDSATADRASFGAQPVQPDAIRKYRPWCLNTAGASIDLPSNTRTKRPEGLR